MFNETFCITVNLRPHGSHLEFQLFSHQFLQRLLYSLCFEKNVNSITEDVQRDLTIIFLILVSVHLISSL